MRADETFADRSWVCLWAFRWKGSFSTSLSIAVRGPKLHGENPQVEPGKTPKTPCRFRGSAQRTAVRRTRPPGSEGRARGGPDAVLAPSACDYSSAPAGS